MTPTHLVFVFGLQLIYIYIYIYDIYMYFFRSSNISNLTNLHRTVSNKFVNYNKYQMKRKTNLVKRMIGKL